MIEYTYTTKNGKYTLEYYKCGKIKVYRYDILWDELIGDNLVLTMLQDLVDKEKN